MFVVAVNVVVVIDATLVVMSMSMSCVLLTSQGGVVVECGEVLDRLGCRFLKSVCLLKERDGRECFASVSSDGKKNKNLRFTRVSLMIYSSRQSTQHI